jgi:hypothetical protein
MTKLIPYHATTSYLDHETIQESSERSELFGRLGLAHIWQHHDLDKSMRCDIDEVKKQIAEFSDADVTASKLSTEQLRERCIIAKQRQYDAWTKDKSNIIPSRQCVTEYEYLQITLYRKEPILHQLERIQYNHPLLGAHFEVLLKEVDASLDCLLDCYHEWMHFCYRSKWDEYPNELQTFLYNKWGTLCGLEHLCLMIFYYEIGGERATSNESLKHFILQNISTTQRNAIANAFVTRIPFEVQLPQPSSNLTTEEQEKFKNEQIQYYDKQQTQAIFNYEQCLVTHKVLRERYLKLVENHRSYLNSIVIPMITFTDDRTFQQDLYLSSYVTPVTEIISPTANAFDKLVYALTLWYPGYGGSIRRTFVIFLENQDNNKPCVHNFKTRVEIAFKKLMNYETTKRIGIKRETVVFRVASNPRDVHLFTSTLTVEPVRSIPVRYKNVLLIVNRAGIPHCTDEARQLYEKQIEGATEIRIPEHYLYKKKREATNELSNETDKCVKTE